AWIRQSAQVAAVLTLVLVACWSVGLLDIGTLADGVPAILTLAREAMPPNFTNARGWIKPLLDTLAMSIAGTAVAVFLSFPLA
ncbi:phosphonate ABC transporter, permease protein PhnE, partial [Vibrio parahaemolyticus]